MSTGANMPRRKKNSPTKIASPRSDSKSHDVIAHLHSLHDEVRRELKGGNINKNTLGMVKELNEYIDKNETAIRKKISKKNKDSKGIEYLLLKSLAMCSEIFDQFGEADMAKKAARDGQEFLSYLQNPDRPCFPTESREILRERIRLTVDYAQAHFYRKHRYLAAKDVIIRCRDFVEDTLKEEESFPCFLTLGQIYYALGKCFRQLHAYSDAEDCFSQAIENYYNRAQRKIGQFPPDSEEYQKCRREELPQAMLRTGICLGLGIGWVNYAKGHLNKALQFINPARTLLLHANDELSAAYVDLIYSSITRALATEGAKSLKEAKDVAQKSYNFFKGKHQRYTARAAWELGLTYFHGGQLDEAEEKVSEVMEISKDLEDQRWLCNTLIMQSRIERKRGRLDEREQPGKHGGAKQLATKALELAKHNNQNLCKINALIRLGEASIDLGNTEDALRDFNEALNLNGDSSASKRVRSSDPKIEALCYLNIARSYARDHEGAKAQEYFQRWKALEKEVEYKYVQELAENVEREIRGLTADFVIKAGKDLDLNYKRHLKALRKFLVDQAKSEASEKEKIAAKLGITRQAIFKWEKDE